MVGLTEIDTPVYGWGGSRMEQSQAQSDREASLWVTVLPWPFFNFTNKHVQKENSLTRRPEEF